MLGIIVILSPRSCARKERETKMKLVVFGGTGPTGVEVVKQALKLGHTVTVIARTLENMEIK